MGRHSSPVGSAAQAQTPPVSVPPNVSDTDPTRQRLERRLVQQSVLAQFARWALSAPPLGLLRAESTALLREFAAPCGPLEPGAQEDERAFVDAVTDILATAATNRRALEASRYAALHDPLTGLANRCLVVDHLTLALARAYRRSTDAAVIFLDLDHFKQINDSLGHIAGDELLVLVAERLRDAVRPSDTLGRWGGDEFVAICDDLQHATDVPALVERIVTAFDAPFPIGDIQLSVTASIGFAISCGTDAPAALIAAADAAMYRAKRPHGPLPGGPPALSGLVARGPTATPPLTRRLLELLSGLEELDLPGAVDDPAVATGV